MPTHVDFHTVAMANTYPIEPELLESAFNGLMLGALDSLRSAVESRRVGIFICVAINEFGEPTIYGPLPSANSGKLQLIGALDSAKRAVNGYIHVGKAE